MGRLEKFRFYRQNDDNNTTVQKALLKAQKQVASWKVELDELSPKILSHYQPFSELSANPVKRKSEPNQVLQSLQTLINNFQTSDFQAIATQADALWLQIKQHDSATGYESWITDDRGMDKIDNLKRFFEDNEQQFIQQTQTFVVQLGNYNKALMALTNEKVSFTTTDLSQPLASSYNPLFKRILLSLLVFFISSLVGLVVLLTLLFTSL